VDDDAAAAGSKVVPSYSKLSRLDRLKASGKADLTEEQMRLSGSSDNDDSDNDDNGDTNDQGTAIIINRRIDKEKKPGKTKQRGKSSSLKRYVVALYSSGAGMTC
jgi:hypothetical protein